jgi:hypothetical protein
MSEFPYLELNIMYWVISTAKFIITKKDFKRYLLVNLNSTEVIFHKYRLTFFDGHLSVKVTLHFQYFFMFWSNKLNK